MRQRGTMLSQKIVFRGYSYNGLKEVLDKGLRFKGGYAIGLELSGWNGTPMGSARSSGLSIQHRQP